MKLEDARRHYYDHTGQASRNVRSLSYAIIAVVWIFRHQSGNQLVIPCGLHLAALCAIVALSLDFLQYVCLSIAWKHEFRWREKAGVDEDEEFKVDVRVNMLGTFFFWTKIACVAFGAIVLLCWLLFEINTA